MHCKRFSHFSNKNNSMFVILTFYILNETLTNDVVNFEQRTQVNWFGIRVLFPSVPLACNKEKYRTILIREINQYIFVRNPGRDMLILFNNSFPRLIMSWERLNNSFPRLIMSWERLIKSWERVILSSERLINSSERLIKSSERLINSSERLIKSSERLINSWERLILCRRNDLLCCNANLSHSPTGTGCPVPIKLEITQPLYTLL